MGGSPEDLAQRLFRAHRKAGTASKGNPGPWGVTIPQAQARSLIAAITEWKKLEGKPEEEAESDAYKEVYKKTGYLPSDDKKVEAY